MFEWCLKRNTFEMEVILQKVLIENKCIFPIGFCWMTGTDTPPKTKKMVK